MSAFYEDLTLKNFGVSWNLVFFCLLLILGICVFADYPISLNLCSHIGFVWAGSDIFTSMSDLNGPVI